MPDTILKLPKLIEGEVVGYLPPKGRRAERTVEVFRQRVSFQNQRDAYYLLKHLRGVGSLTYVFQWDFETEVVKAFEHSLKETEQNDDQ